MDINRDEFPAIKEKTLFVFNLFVEIENGPGVSGDPRIHQLAPSTEEKVKAMNRLYSEVLDFYRKRAFRSEANWIWFMLKPLTDRCRRSGGNPYKISAGHG